MSTVEQQPEPAVLLHELYNHARTGLQCSQGDRRGARTALAGVVARIERYYDEAVEGA